MNQKQIKLKMRQALPLDEKIQLTKHRIRDWITYWDIRGVTTHVSFSGGKDSTVLLHLVDQVDPTVPAVFSDTGLEYPEIRNFVKSFGDRVTWVKPDRTFRDVLHNEGWPVISKKVSSAIRRMNQTPHSEKNANTRRLYMTGYRQDGTYSPNSKIPDKWMSLVGDGRPFETSDKCCDVFKKDPLRNWSKANGNSKPITGMMASEGGLRAVKYEQCNMYDAKEPISNPMFFWTEQDVWSYIERYHVEICEIYHDRTIGGIPVEGEKRTGCMFCMYGVHLEKGQNRFQKMKITHPKQWDYCINKLGMGRILSLLGVNYGE